MEEKTKMTADPNEFLKSIIDPGSDLYRMLYHTLNCLKYGWLDGSFIADKITPSTLADSGSLLAVQQIESTSKHDRSMISIDTALQRVCSSLAASNDEYIAAHSTLLRSLKPLEFSGTHHGRYRDDVAISCCIPNLRIIAENSVNFAIAAWKLRDKLDPGFTINFLIDDSPVSNLVDIAMELYKKYQVEPNWYSHGLYKFSLSAILHYRDPKETKSFVICDVNTHYPITQIWNLLTTGMLVTPFTNLKSPTYMTLQLKRGEAVPYKPTPIVEHLDRVESKLNLKTTKKPNSIADIESYHNKPKNINRGFIQNIAVHEIPFMKDQSSANAENSDAKKHTLVEWLPVIYEASCKYGCQQYVFCDNGLCMHELLNIRLLSKMTLEKFRQSICGFLMLYHIDDMLGRRVECVYYNGAKTSESPAGSFIIIM